MNIVGIAGFVTITDDPTSSAAPGTMPMGHPANKHVLKNDGDRPC